MKSAAKTTPGSVRRSVRVAAIAAVAGLLAGGLAFAQSLYKYKGPDGEWIYTDVPPPDDAQVEVRDLQKGDSKPGVSVWHSTDEEGVHFYAKNDYHAPIEIILALDQLNNLEAPPGRDSLRWTLEPRSEIALLELGAVDLGAPSSAEYRYIWLHGDPKTRHNPERPYRAPYAVSSSHRVSQAFPMSITHVTADSYYAVDFEMPIGTDIYAARGGVVFEVASTNFRGGTDPGKDLPAANLVRILHDDGSFAIYAHLNWNSIRVRPGDRVERGEYIADSGNTGFSTGPHLHFVVLVNRGLRLESVPVVFEGSNGSPVTPTTDEMLVAHP